MVLRCQVLTQLPLMIAHQGGFFTVARRSPYRASAIVNLGFLILGTAVSTSFKRRLADLV